MHDGFERDGAATFDARFHTGDRLHVTASHATMSDRSGRVLGTLPRSYVAGGGAAGGDDVMLANDAPTHMREAVNHARRALCTALRVEELHATAFGDDASYPVVVGGRDRDASSGAQPSRRRGGAHGAAAGVGRSGGGGGGPTLSHAAFARTAGWAVMLESGETWLLRPDGGQLLLSARADRLVCVDPGDEDVSHARCLNLAGGPAAPKGTREAVAVAAAADALAAVSNKSRSNPSATIEAGISALLECLATASA
jgi:hypothetical protein